MAGGTKPFDLSCPCCGAIIVVDPDTHAILRHEVPKKPLADFEAMLKDVGESKKKTETKLQRALEEQKKREEILEKKFREAIRKAEDSDEPPLKPFDLD